jgi:hypothetical protein
MFSSPTSHLHQTSSSRGRIRLSASPKAIRCRHPLPPQIKNIDRPSLDVLVTRFPPSSNFIRLSRHPLIRSAEGNPLLTSVSLSPKQKHRSAFDRCF